MQPNEIKIRIKGSDHLKAADASFITYHFPYLQESASVFQNQFNTKDTE